MKNITPKFASPFLLALLASLAGGASAAEVYGGNGIGFANSDSPWVANFVFSKQDAKAGASASIKTGDDITPAQQKGGGAAIIVPTTSSIAWCDPSANPNNPNSTDFGQCYGSGNDSRWAVVDLNDLQKRGLTNIWVSITAKPYHDDLVPALTVFQGRQDVGANLGWYPNTFQQQSFWAWKLTPFAGGKTGTTGYATSYTGNLGYANVTGKLKLKPGGQNYLTIAVGGDARNAITQHAVNFELAVSISKKQPSPPSSTSGGGGSASGGIDKCGCEIGVTEWHPTMGHCMSVTSCNTLTDPGDQCKTPAMCEKDGGR